MASTKTSPTPIESGPEQRVLITAPIAADAAVLRDTLASDGLRASVCDDLVELCTQVELGAAMAILAEEALAAQSRRLLVETLASQPEWSDFPLVILVSGDGLQHRGVRLLEELRGSGHALLLQRPFRRISLLSLVRAALQSRGRQYQVRDALLERERAERAVRESEERFRLVVQNLPAAIYTTDREGRLTLFNEAAVELWGYRPTAGDDQLCGSCEILHPDGRTMPFEASPMAVGLREGRALPGQEFVIQRSDGSRRHVLAQPMPLLDSDDQLVSMVNMLLDITERKRAEEAREFLATIVQSTDDAVISKTLNGRITSWNPGAERIFGYREAETVGQSIKLIVPKELHEEERYIIARLRRGERIEHFETVRVAKDGRRVEISLTVSPILDSSGHVIGASKVARDISDRRRSEQALRESEERFRTLADNMSQLAWMADAQGWIFWYNKRWCDYTGTTLEQMQGWGWKAVHHPDHIDRVVERIQRSWDTGEIWEDTFPLRSKDGDYRWFLSRALPIRNEQGEVIRWLGTHTDVTEQQAAEEALRVGEERIRLAVESADVGTWDLDVPTGALTWSDRCKAVFGLAPEDAVTYEVFLERIHPEDRDKTDRAVQDALDPLGDGRYETEYRSLTPDGTVRWIVARGQTFFEGQGAARRARRFVGTTLDITDRKRHEAQLQTAMAELNHRVKNTLATIDAVAQQTLEHTRDLQEFGRSFSARLRSIAAAHSLLTRAEWRGTQLRDILLAELQARVPTREHLATTGPDVLIRPKAALALHMAIHELTTNASKYGALSVADGRLDISWRVVDAEAGPTLRLEWCERDGPPVYEPKQVSFGSQLIDDVIGFELNGTVERTFKSKGLQCAISLPMADLGRLAKVARDNDQPYDVDGSADITGPGRETGRKLRILVVEDNYSIAQRIGRELGAAGCAVVGPVGTYERASEVIERADFDAALLDVDLDGRAIYPLADTLISRDIPFALLTGFNVADLPPSYARHTVLSKPLAIEALENWLNRVARQTAR